MRRSLLPSLVVEEVFTFPHSFMVSLCLVQIKDGEKEKVDAFFGLNSYVKGTYDQKGSFETLNAELCKLEEGFAGGNRLFYLSLPPSVFASVTTNLKECCMSKRLGRPSPYYVY